MADDWIKLKLHAHLDYLDDVKLHFLHLSFKLNFLRLFSWNESSRRFRRRTEHYITSLSSPRYYSYSSQVSRLFPLYTGHTYTSVFRLCFCGAPDPVDAIWTHLVYIHSYYGFNIIGIACGQWRVWYLRKGRKYLLSIIKSVICLLGLDPEIFFWNIELLRWPFYCCAMATFFQIINAYRQIFNIWRTSVDNKLLITQM